MTLSRFSPSFVVPASSVESTVFLKLSLSPLIGVASFTSVEPPSLSSPLPTFFSRSTETEVVTRHVSFDPISSSGSSSFRGPPPPGDGQPLSLALIIGATIGGILLGALAVVLIIFCRRRRNKSAVMVIYEDEGSYRSSSQICESHPEATHTEKKARLSPIPVRHPTSRVREWMHHNRVASVSSDSSFSSPTVIESVGHRSSLSAYSQASAFGPNSPPSYSTQDGMPKRPPGLYRISE
ncbi:hypothetical protein C8J57DRAFT_1270111 [Mycena rebaudengoi]|nr:hypothetical protein C8J57DRAFT_1270111 [Mycena rebaudengoi]